MWRTRGNCGSRQDEISAAIAREAPAKTDKSSSGSSTREVMVRADAGCSEQERDTPWENYFNVGIISEEIARRPTNTSN